ncbi:hypothetical protein J6590_105370, partial [Homalodisca vitripennis]
RQPHNYSYIRDTTIPCGLPQKPLDSAHIARLGKIDELYILLIAARQYQALCYIINSANHLIIRK